MNIGKEFAIAAKGYNICENRYKELLLMSTYKQLSEIYFDESLSIVLKNSSEDLVIYSKEFGPHPVMINLKDEKGNILMSVENEESDVTFFKVANSSIKSGYQVEVLDGFESAILIKKIVKK